MDILRRSAEHPGRWVLGGRLINAGDTLEVFILGKWYVAEFKYDDLLREYRMHVLGKDMPILTDMQARFPQAPQSPEGAADQDMPIDDGPTL